MELLHSMLNKGDLVPTVFVAGCQFPVANQQESLAGLHPFSTH